MTDVFLQTPDLLLVLEHCMVALHQSGRRNARKAPVDQESGTCFFLKVKNIKFKGLFEGFEIK